MKEYFKQSAFQNGSGYLAQITFHISLCSMWRHLAGKNQTGTFEFQKSPGKPHRFPLVFLEKQSAGSERPYRLFIRYVHTHSFYDT